MSNADAFPMGIWAPNVPYTAQDMYKNDGYRFIPILLTNAQIECKDEFKLETAGCWHPEGTITIEAPYAFQVVGHDGCTTWDHEAWHAWGFAHGEGPLGNVEACNPK